MADDTSNRSIFRAFFFTTAGHLDISWLLTLIVTVAGLAAFLIELVTHHRASLLGWSFISSVFVAVLTASVPISKARLLADSKTIENAQDDFAKLTPEQLKGQFSDSSVG